MPVDIKSQIHGAWSEAFNKLNRGQEGIDGLLEVTQFWNICSEFLKPRNLDEVDWNAIHRDQLNHKLKFRVLRDADLHWKLYDRFLSNVEASVSMLEKDIKRTLQRIEESERLSASPQTYQLVNTQLERFVGWMKAWEAPLVAFESSSLVKGFQEVYIQHLHRIIPIQFIDVFRKYLAISLDNPIASPPSPQLLRLGFLTRFPSIFFKTSQDKISEYVKTNCSQVWEAGLLENCRKFTKEQIYKWWESCYASPSVDSGTLEDTLRPVKMRLDFFAMKVFCDMRTDELFDIIVNYPDSTPALDDFQLTLSKNDSRQDLIRSLSAAIKKRLLHPGASTKDIISTYVSTIRTLRKIDPAGVLLHQIGQPIRQHLKNREDTIRCIVSSLIEEEGELTEGDESEIRMLQMNIMNEGDGPEDYSDSHWKPEPVDAAPEFRSGKASDIISTLVSIFDSKEIIVKELQVLLASRLLAVKDYDLNQEIRIVELLKLRFGEASLSACEVMLKDLADSKRTDNHIHSDSLAHKTSIHPTIISRLFWPPFATSSLVLPGQLAHQQRRYEKAFHRFKPDKKLKWMPQLGSIELLLEFEDRNWEGECTMLQAGIVELFGGDRKEWLVSDLCDALGVKERPQMINALNFWSNNGVLKNMGNDTWLLLEVADNEAAAQTRTVVMEEDSAIQGVQDAQVEQLRTYLSFINGMLTNFNGLPLDRIQSMLAYADGYDKTIEQLEAFMEALRREGTFDKRADGFWILRAG